MEHKHIVTISIMPMFMFVGTYRMLIMASAKLSLSSARTQELFIKT